MHGPSVAIPLAILVAVVAACGVSPQPAPPPTASAVGQVEAGRTVAPPVAARLARELDAALAESGAPGVQAAVILADGSLWTAGAGTSRPDQPMTSDLLTPIASVTKVYTAALILDLAEDGTLSLDDHLTRWLPSAPNGEGVTIRHLLTHTSGLASDDASLPPVCEPGTCYSYSNSGYNVLGQIIEAASRLDYAHTLRDRFLRPLGLATTSFPPQEAVAGVSATGHAGGEERTAVDLARELGPGAHGAAGAILATAADMARFGRGLVGGSLLDRASLDILLDVGSTRGLPGTSECMPAAVVSRHESDLGRSWFHGGNKGLFRSWLEHYEDIGLTIAVVTNADVPAGGIGDRLARAARATTQGVAAGRPTGSCEDDIAIRSPDGTTRLVTTDIGFDGMPSWSPDGDRVVWAGLRGDRSDLFVVDLATGSIDQLTDDAARDLFPRWSPDGLTIAFSSNRDGDFEVHLIDPDGSDLLQITHDDVDEFGPAWSPDGTRLAYVSQDDGQHIRVMSPDGTNDHSVTSGAGREWYPTWSPDGERIAYESGGVIFIIPADGGEPVRLPIPQVRVTTFPWWSPGADIVFSSDGDLFSSSEDGSSLVRLTATPADELTPAWSPDGSSVAFQLSHWVPSGT